MMTTVLMLLLMFCVMSASQFQHIYKPFQGKELTLQFTCAGMHTVLSVLGQQLFFFFFFLQILNLFFHNSSATECYNQEMAQPHEVNTKDVIRV